LRSQEPGFRGSAVSVEDAALPLLLLLTSDS
jgi:hypothetical protein